MVRMIGPASGAPYEAYSGPETGGFGVFSEEDVPEMDPAAMEFVSQVGTLAQSPAAPYTVRKGLRALGPALPAGPAQAPVGPQQQRSMLARTTIMPKGGSSKDVLANEAREIYREMTQPRPLADDRSTAGNIAQSHLTEVGNNILAAPSVVGDFLTYPVRKIANVVRGNNEFENPTPWFGAMPRVTTADIMSHVPTSPDDNRTAAQRAEAIELAEAERRARYPVSSTVGDLTGIAQTVGLGRAPFSRGLRRREVAVEKKIDRGMPMSQKAMFNRADWKKALDRSTGWNSFQKVMGRTVESGVEGAGIALLHNGDPVETAAYTAGAQGVLGGTLQVMQHKWLPIKGAGRLANLAINSAILGQLFYVADIAMPGPAKDYEATKAAAQKAIWGYALGAATGLVAARSRSGMISAAAPGKHGPEVMDVLASAPRNMMQGYLEDYISSDEGRKASLKEKLSKFYSNIDNISEEDLRAVTAAFGADKDRFYRELDRVTGGLQ